MSDWTIYLIIDLVVLPWSVKALLMVWFQQGGIFEKQVMWLEARGGFLGHLAQCPFCLSFHIAFWLFTLGTLPPLIVACYDPWKGLLLKMATCWIIYIPAIAVIGWQLFDCNDGTRNDQH